MGGEGQRQEQVKIYNLFFFFSCKTKGQATRIIQRGLSCLQILTDNKLKRECEAEEEFSKRVNLGEHYTLELFYA